jgi:peptidoglycan/LPS O-acetylase OafA/YrhL
MVAGLFACLLCVAVNWQALSELRFLRFTGKISYCLYLAHVPLFTVAALPAMRQFWMFRSNASGDAALFISAFLTCYVVAASSWELFESKFLGLKERFNYQLHPANKNTPAHSTEQPCPARSSQAPAE